MRQGKAIPESEAQLRCRNFRLISTNGSQREIDPWMRLRRTGVLSDTPVSARTTKT